MNPSVPAGQEMSVSEFVVVVPCVLVVPWVLVVGRVVVVGGAIVSVVSFVSVSIVTGGVTGDGRQARDARLGVLLVVRRGQSHDRPGGESDQEQGAERRPEPDRRLARPDDRARIPRARKGNEPQPALEAVLLQRVVRRSAARAVCSPPCGCSRPSTPCAGSGSPPPGVGSCGGCAHCWPWVPSSGGDGRTMVSSTPSAAGS